eukprot:COSAG06_NODE_49213_length_327_cov_0.649123_1_plen_64_part_00
MNLAANWNDGWIASAAVRAVIADATAVYRAEASTWGGELHHKCAAVGDIDLTESGGTLLRWRM